MKKEKIVFLDINGNVIKPNDRFKIVGTETFGRVCYFELDLLVFMNEESKRFDWTLPAFVKCLESF